MSQIRRRQMFVDVKLQGALLVHVALYWLYCLLSVVFFAFLWIVFSKRPPTSADLFQQLWDNFGPVLIGSGLLLPLVLLDCMRISNRLAGPMLRLRREMKALADGEVPRPVQLRDGDFWRGFAEDWNRALARQSSAELSPDLSPPSNAEPGVALRNSANSASPDYADTVSA